MLCVLSSSKFICIKILLVACEGCELIEWLLSWSFVTMREEGCQLANSLLNEVYLEPVGGLSKESFKKHSHWKKLAFVYGVGSLYRFVSLCLVDLICMFGTCTHTHTHTHTHTLVYHSHIDVIDTVTCY